MNSFLHFTSFLFIIFRYLGIPDIHQDRFRHLPQREA